MVLRKQSWRVGALLIPALATSRPALPLCAGFCPGRVGMRGFVVVGGDYRAAASPGRSSRMTYFHSPSPSALRASSSSWSCAASFVSCVGVGVGPGVPVLDRSVDGNTAVREAGGELHDLTSPRGWLEFNDARSGGGCGAYTVIRCDLPVAGEWAHVDLSNRWEGRRENDSSADDGIPGGAEPELCSRSNLWKVWGEEFHLDRLRQSYCALILASARGDAGRGADIDSLDPTNEEILDEATSRSRALIDSLLSEAEGALFNADGFATGLDDRSFSTDLSVTVMLTLLWTPLTDDIRDNDILAAPALGVLGHIFSTGKTFSTWEYNPDPIIANVAAPLNAPTLYQEWMSLPNRCLNLPKAKLSSWCQTRRPLEETYKHIGVEEVLLIRPPRRTNPVEIINYVDWELLEGLTSNLFVIYSDGTLRTGQTDVLDGFARQLVLQCAERCGILHDPAPILMQDAKKGLWTEVFVTSAIKLVVPVGRILFPKLKGTAIEMIWSETPLDDLPWSRRWWSTFHEEMNKVKFS